ncbi:MAG TPA: ATP-binding protein [Planctomycetota bacterium]|nr:ATP-binding protein [Planctomycetota bacterium]
MWTPFRRLSISWKIAILIAGTSTLVLGAAGVAFYYYEKASLREATVADYTSITEITADNVTAAMAFKDKQDATTTLQTLALRPDFLLAAIYDNEKKLFASFERQQNSVPAAPPLLSGYRMDDEAIEIVLPIKQGLDTFGILYVRADLTRVQNRLGIYKGVVTFIVLLGALMSFLMAALIQRVISSPLSKLTHAARNVTETRDFSIRVPHTSEDEIGILIDQFNRMLSELQRQNTALQESENRFRTMADTAPVLIWVNNRDGCAFVNRHYEQFTGRTLQQIAGVGWAELLHPDDAKAYLAAYDQALRDKARFESTVRLRRADGEFRWVKSIGMPLLNREGEVEQCVGCSLDITDIKLYEQALRDADRRKDEFLAMLAHELRNPLGPIRNAAHAMRKIGPANETLERLRSMIDRQIGHMSKIIDDLLDVSRITRGKILLRKEMLELGALVRTTVEDYRTGFEQNNVRLSLSMPQRELWVTGDRTRLAQCIGNLLHNAQKFTASGGLVEVLLENEGANARIVVRDNGIGIDSALLGRLFQPFAQAEQSLDRNRGGLGLGLALVKGLIGLHGGSVSVFSDGAGRGASFSISLPLEISHLHPRVPHEHSVPHVARKILIVEDNADAAESLKMLLKLNHHDVEVARNGQEGIRAARTQKPEVVLCDIGLPGGLSGYDVCRELRSQMPQTLFVALTGYGQEEDQKHAKDAGFDYHLTKPVDPETLERLISTLKFTPVAAPAVHEEKA